MTRTGPAVQIGHEGHVLLDDASVIALLHPIERHQFVGGRIEHLPVAQPEIELMVCGVSQAGATSTGAASKAVAAGVFGPARRHGGLTRRRGRARRRFAGDADNGEQRKAEQTLFEIHFRFS